MSLLLTLTFSEKHGGHGPVAMEEPWVPQELPGEQLLQKVARLNGKHLYVNKK